MVWVLGGRPPRLTNRKLPPQKLETLWIMSRGSLWSYTTLGYFTLFPEACAELCSLRSHVLNLTGNPGKNSHHHDLEPGFDSGDQGGLCNQELSGNTQESSQKDRHHGLYAGRKLGPLGPQLKQDGEELADQKHHAGASDDPQEDGGQGGRIDLLEQSAEKHEIILLLSLGVSLPCGGDGIENGLIVVAPSPRRNLV